MYVHPFLYWLTIGFIIGCLAIAQYFAFKKLAEYLNKRFGGRDTPREFYRPPVFIEPRKQELAFKRALDAAFDVYLYDHNLERWQRNVDKAIKTFSGDMARYMLGDFSKAPTEGEVWHDDCIIPPSQRDNNEQT